jgi:hypothetical protein
MVASVLKKLIGIALILLLATSAFSASTARQVDFLAAGIEKDGDPCTGCKVYTYETGTTTAKATYTNRAKGSEQTNPIVLDSEGRAEVFADGLYKMVIKTAADGAYFDIDGLDYGASGATFTSLSQYDGLEEAISDIGGTETVLVIDTTDELNNSFTVPTNVTLHVFQYDSIDLNGKTLTVNGGIVAPPIEWLIGTGTFTGSPIVHYYDTAWTASTLTDSATPSYSDINLGNPTVTGNLVVNGTSQFNDAVSIQNTSAFYNSAVFNTTTTFNEKAVFTNTVVWTKGSDIDVSTGDNIINATNSGNYFDVTNSGVANITGIYTEGIGTSIKFHFDADVTLINSTDLELTGAANITTAAGDELEFVEYASGDWRMTNFEGGQLTLLTSPSAGSLVLSRHGIQNSTTSASLVPRSPAFRVMVGGTYTGAFDIKHSTGGAETTRAQWYKNGATEGSEQNTNSTSYVEKSVDFTLAAGDYVQLWIRQNGGGTAFCNDVEMRTDKYTLGVTQGAE